MGAGKKGKKGGRITKEEEEVADAEQVSDIDSAAKNEAAALGAARHVEQIAATKAAEVAKAAAEVAVEAAAQEEAAALEAAAQEEAAAVEAAVQNAREVAASHIQARMRGQSARQKFQADKQRHAEDEARRIVFGDAHRPSAASALSALSVRRAEDEARLLTAATAVTADISCQPAEPAASAGRTGLSARTPTGGHFRGGHLSERAQRASAPETKEVLLRRAATQGHVDLVTSLLERKANVNAHDVRQQDLEP